MSGDNSVHPELGEKEPILMMKETKTYKYTIANPSPVYVFPLPVSNLSYIPF